MGLLKSKPAEEPAEVGELLAVEALSRDGVLVTSEGAFVRYLRVSAKNPLVMADDEREIVGATLGRLVGELQAGQSVQFYVEARPVQLDAMLEQSAAGNERAVAAALADGQAERGEALRRLQDACRESLVQHADAQAAVDVAYYVVIPYAPDHSLVPDWRSMVRPGRRQPRAPLVRDAESHRRVMRESLVLTDAIRMDLESLDLATHMLSGPEVLDLLWRRFNPTTADRSPALRPGVPRARLEVLGELDLERDAAEAASAARALRELVANSAYEAPDQRYLRVDGDLEQVLFVVTPPEATYVGWLLDAMQVRRPYTLSVHIHALDRLRERSRHRARHRRLFGVNRGAEMRGRVVDFDMIAQEDEARVLVEELSGQERAAVYEVSIYQSIREPGPQPDPRRLAEAVEYTAREITASSDARVNQGQLRQPGLWQSTLPLGRDIARRTRKYVTRNVGDTVPLVGTHSGSPSGVPFAFTDPGRELILLDPFDPSHDNGTLLINARSGGGKTFAVNILLSRFIAQGMNAFVIDRAGHYEFLTSLIPGAQQLLIGSSREQHTVNPWDVPDTSSPSIEKVDFLIGLHALLVGDQRSDQDAYGITALERNLLEVAIRSVYAKASAAEMAPRESMLRDELLQRAREEGRGGSSEVGGTLRTLAERLVSFCGDGSHAFLLDRETTVPHDAPLLVFDTRMVPSELTGAVLFAIAEHVSSRLETRQRELRRDADGGGRYVGRSMLVIDEAWKLVGRRATGEWVNDLARRARHLGLFLVAISQQLSDFAGEYGRALIRNSTMQLFLRQSPDELRYVQDALRLSEEEIHAIGRLKTVKRSYSQAYWINGTRGRGTIALRVGAKEYWAATSDPIVDAPERDAALREVDNDPWRALEVLSHGDLQRAED
jgi:hypothetical protein